MYCWVSCWHVGTTPPPSKTPTLHAVTAEVIELNNRNISKRRRLFPARGQSWNMKHEIRVAESEKSFKKLHRFKHELKITFFFQFSTLNRGGWNVAEKRWGKQSYLATSRGDIREAYTILAYCFTDCSLHVYTSIHQ